MVSAEVISALSGLSVVQGALTIVAAYYAYRITRLVGVFWAWALIVAASAIYAFRAISSVGPVSFYNPKLLGPALSQFSTGAIVFSEIINLAAAILFAVGMYGLFRIFRGKKDDAARTRIEPPQ